MIRIAAYLVFVGAALEGLGLLSPGLNRTLVACALIVLGFSFRNPSAAFLSNRRRAILGAVALALAVPAALLAPLGALWFGVCVLTAFAFWFEPEAGGECAAFALATALVAIAAEANRVLPVLWHSRLALARLASGLSAFLVDEPRGLGPTAMGLSMWGALLALVLARRITGARQRGAPLWIATLVICIANVAYLCLLTPLARWIARLAPSLPGLLLDSQWLALLVGAFAVAIADAIAKRRVASGAARSDHVVSSGLPATGSPAAWIRDRRTLAGAAIGLAFALIAGRAPAPPAKPARVMLYDAGYTNWDTPRPGSY